jgi:hypothetical protein
MSANCLNTLGNGGYQPINFALSWPTSGKKSKNPSHLQKARQLAGFSTELPGHWCEQAPSFFGWNLGLHQGYQPTTSE